VLDELVLKGVGERHKVLSCQERIDLYILMRFVVGHILVLTKGTKGEGLTTKDVSEENNRARNRPIRRKEPRRTSAMFWMRKG